MRKLKIATKDFSTSVGVKKLLEKAKAKSLSDEEQQKLLSEIRNRNVAAINKLVASWEIFIVKIALEFSQDIMELNYLIKISKRELTKLAKSEIGSMSRERFFRFGARLIRQTILSNNDKVKKNGNEK